MPFDFDASPLSLSGLFPATTAPVQIDVYGYCQMACAYCFSNLNKSAAGRELNLKSSLPTLLRALDRAMEDPESPIGWLLREKYYIGLSNTTDPFQREEKTHRATEAVLKWAAVHEQPLFVETKGNVLLEEWDRYAPLLDPARTCVYVSLSMLDDKIRRAIEPGAMSVADRLKLMRRLADLGCGVIAACNPYVPEWLPDLDAYCRAVKDAGATDVFPFYLHLTNDQAAQVPAFYGDKMVALANVLPAFQLDGFRRWQEAADRCGLKCALAPYWDAKLGYDRRTPFAETALQARGQQFYPFHEFMRECAAFSEDHGGAPVLFAWRTVADRLRKWGVGNPTLKTSPFNSTFAHSSQGHREWGAAFGKTADLHSVFRWLYNTPWFKPRRVVWNDPHVRTLFSRERDLYEGTAEGDLIAVYLPSPPQTGELMIDRNEFDFAGCARMTP